MTTGVWDLVDGHAAYWAVSAATEAGVLDALRDRAAAADVAATLGTTLERLVPVLDVLVDVGVLERDGDRYGATPAAGEALAMRGLLAGSPGRHENWLALAGVLRGDDPPHPVDEDDAFRSSLARSTFPIQRALAARVAAVLPPLASVHAIGPSAEAWIEGLGGVPTAQPAAVVVLAHACRERDADGARALVADASAQVAPGGHLVVADYLTDADEPMRAHRARVLGLTMVVNTRRGCAYPAAAYRRWLTDAGLVEVRSIDGRPAPHDVLVARQPTENERQLP